MNPLSITESIVEHLRIHIIVGALKPGQKLNEVKLSSHLGVSRPPLREAFRVRAAIHWKFSRKVLFGSTKFLFVIHM